MVSAYVYLQEGNIAEGEQRINLAIRHALLRCNISRGTTICILILMPCVL